jgi:hypothetical protein
VRAILCRAEVSLNQKIALRGCEREPGASGSDPPWGERPRRAGNAVYPSLIFSNNLMGPAAPVTNGATNPITY